MEDTVITSTTEPTVVESANTSAENTAGLSQVIDQATPMDSNTTYSNLPKTDYQPAKSTMQNLINDAVHKEQTINQDTNAGKAMNSFLTGGYDYDKNEAGSYWVAGAINDNNTQMSFLQTLINEEMYDEMDLQKYYYDTNLATARAYAAQKGKETAYGFYRAAQERALAEGELTGWYMPAEGRYLLGQYTVAQNTLENPDATPEEISKANRVTKAAESWFSANQITTRGIKCLAMMNYEENVRHNTIMGELQKQANAIAGQGAAASAASAELAHLNLKFKVEEEEMDSGYNYSNKLGWDNDDHIGHREGEWGNTKYLRGYSNLKDMLKNDTEHFGEVRMANSLQYIKGILGDDYYEAYTKYENDQSLSGHKADISSNKAITENSAGFSSTGKKTKDGKEIKYTVVGNEVVVGYFNDGVWVPITDEKTAFADGTTIKTFIENMFGKGSMNTEGINSVEIDGKTYSFGRGETWGHSTSFTSLNQQNSKAWDNNDMFGVNNVTNDKYTKKVSQLETNEGIKDSTGKLYKNMTYEPDVMSKDGSNSYTIFSKTVNGKKTYYEVQPNNKGDNFKLVKVSEDKIVKNLSVKGTLKTGTKIDLSTDLNGDSDRERVGKASWVIGYDPDTNESYMMLPHGDGTVEYYTVKGDVSKSGTFNRSFEVSRTGLSESDVTNTMGSVTLTPGKDYGAVTSKVGYYNGSKSTSKVDSSSPNIEVPSGGSASFQKNAYTPEQITAVYNKVGVSMEDVPKIPKDINNIEELKEYLENYKSINNVIGGE